MLWNLQGKVGRCTDWVRWTVLTVLVLYLFMLFAKTVTMWLNSFEVILKILHVSFIP